VVLAPRADTSPHRGPAAAAATRLGGVPAPFLTPSREPAVPLRRSARLLAVAAVALLGLLTGCTSHTTRCSGSTCTVNLTGAQTVDVDPRTDWRSDLQVGPIEPAAVTVSAYGDAARLTPGTAAEVSGLRVELVSVSGSDVSLRVDRA
jgi:hypothetical protein